MSAAVKQPRRYSFESLEVRWFLPAGASVAAMLESWFGPTQDEGKRIDHYLRTGRSDLNLKARLEEGKPAKVETKYLVGSLGATDLATNISGELQRWTKLSLSLNDPKLTRRMAPSDKEAPAAKVQDHDGAHAGSK